MKGYVYTHTDELPQPERVPGWYGQGADAKIGRIHRIEQGEPAPLPSPDIIPTDEATHYVECKCGLWVNVELVHCPACGRKLVRA